MGDVSAELEPFLGKMSDQRMSIYLDLVRIPSVWALPEHAGDCRRAAEFLADQLRDAGLEHVEVSETGGAPVVRAEWLHADGAPTVIAYGHYDVQPPDPLELWETAPFDPIVRDGRVIARGAEDNQGVRPDASPRGRGAPARADDRPSLGRARRDRAGRPSPLTDRAWRSRA